jgi:hypothetical protein
MDTMIPPMQEAVQCDKRLVLISTEGDHAGLHQIFGRIAAADVPRLQTFIPEIRFSDGRTSGASLIRVDQRAVYYRELILPTSVKQQRGVPGTPDGPKTFQPTQR